MGMIIVGLEGLLTFLLWIFTWKFWWIIIGLLLALLFLGVFKIGRTVKRILEDAFNRRRRIRIVVLGSKNSGKTVFLTALASNLLNHRKEHFDLNGWEAYFDEGLLHGVDKKIPDFPYSQYREGFAKDNPEWPEKTTNEMRVLRLPLVFRKKDSKQRDLIIEFLDLPGERIADLTMANKSYKEWCEWMFTKFGGSYCANRPYLDYLKMARSVATWSDLFKAYKDFLRTEHKRFSPWIVPSIVKLTKDGKAMKFLNELDDRPLGLSSEDQFVPVPVEWFDQTHERYGWTKDFSVAYDKYKETIVDPMRDWLDEADRLVYLVDILNILKCGKDVYNQEQKFGGELLASFSQHKSYRFGGAICDGLSNLVKTRIKNAFLVVTKKDLAVSEQSDNLRNLADELLGKELRGLKEGIDKERNIKTCAAVDTVRSERDESGGERTYARTSSNGSEAEYRQVPVPPSWPSSEDWKRAIQDSSYWFDDTYPQFDERENASPPQSGLDELMQMLLASEIG